MADPVNYEAVLADLEAKKAQIESAIATIRSVMGLAPGTDPGSPTPSGGGTPVPGVFLGMSIPEAAKKHLASARKKLSTKDLMAALEAGGLPSSKYTTVYGVLRRREENIGDIINMQGDWALAEWYPNHARAKSKAPAAKPEAEPTPKEKDASKTASH